ncbi:MAG TPA: hypothetical protein VN893_13645 [Bryobacteraceae bacterium]|nr:hypothetical protein [Bryobacteraceae bacterium]
MLPEPSTAVQAQAPTKRRFVRLLGWSALAGFGGAVVYSLFTILTGAEASRIGIPVGLVVGQTMYYASGKRGGRWFQVLAVCLAFVAFDLTYAPGMAGVAFKHGITVLTLAFFIFITVVSPAIDAQNGFLGQFMVVAGMYLAWTLARTRKAA